MNSEVGEDTVQFRNDDKNSQIEGLNWESRRMSGRGKIV